MSVDIPNTTKSENQSHGCNSFRSYLWFIIRSSFLIFDFILTNLGALLTNLFVFTIVLSFKYFKAVYL